MRISPQLLASLGRLLAFLGQLLASLGQSLGQLLGVRRDALASFKLYFGLSKAISARKQKTRILPGFFKGFNSSGFFRKVS